MTGARSSNPARTARRAAGALIALVALVGLTAGPQARAAKDRLDEATIGFGSPSIADPVRTYGEPDIRISAADGAVYVSGPWGTGTQRSIWNRSIDGGRTFLPMHSPAIETAAESDTNIPCPPEAGNCPGGGDTEISIDRSGKVYYADLAALVTLKTAIWDPATKTMQTGLIANGEQGLNGYDRQWFANWDPPVRPPDYTGPLPVNYLMYAEAVAGCCQAAAYSTDGVNYTGPTEEYSIANDGPTVIDQETGTVLEAIGVDSEADVGVAILTRDPAAPDDPALRNAQIVKIADLPAGTTEDALFPVIAIDRSRTAYVAWTTRADAPADTDPNFWQVWYSYAAASTGWTEWSTPRKISSAPAGTNLMPWITAGTAGRIAVVWYGTSDTAHHPSTEDVHQAWFPYVAVVTGANTGNPTVVQTAVTRHPNHYGTICLEGLGCILVQGNRNNADFFQVTTDPRDGAVVVSYNDTSNELVQQVPPIPEGAVDHRGAAQVMVVRQTRGIGLFGTPVRRVPTTGTSMKDPSGDALFDPIYGASTVPELDLRAVAVHTEGANVVFDLGVSSLSDLSHPLVATGAGAVDYVIRWIGAPVEDPDTGTQNPIYYAAVEVEPGELFTAFAGKMFQSIDLCSVSACFPHVLDYGGVGNGGTAVDVTLRHNAGFDSWQIVVPRSVVGDPVDGSYLESFSAFTFARKQSASIQIPNTDAEAGILPVEIDGICCIEARLGP